MCTVSWATCADGYELFCNRDERRTRGVARPPALGDSRGVRFIAPADADAGGTWVAVNEHGLTLCLLNRDAEEEAASPRVYKSRGLLLPPLMCSREPAEVVREVAREGLSEFRPFTLLAIAPGARPAVAAWTGGGLLISEGAVTPLTSSSDKGSEVTRTRKELFRAMTGGTTHPTADLIRRFHASHLPAPGPLSVCMHRPDASTVSFSRVTVTDTLVEFYYQPGPPCAGARGVRAYLPRAGRREDCSRLKRGASAAACEVG